MYLTVGTWVRAQVTDSALSMVICPFVCPRTSIKYAARLSLLAFMAHCSQSYIGRPILHCHEAIEMGVIRQSQRFSTLFDRRKPIRFFYPLILQCNEAIKMESIHPIETFSILLVRQCIPPGLLRLAAHLLQNTLAVYTFTVSFTWKKGKVR